MKFHAHETTWDDKRLNRLRGVRGEMDRAYGLWKKECKGKEGMYEREVLDGEYKWNKASKPYYKVYPCVVDALCRLKLDIKYEAPEVPEGALCIRFAEENEPSTKKGSKISSILVHKSELFKTFTSLFMRINLTDSSIVEARIDPDSEWWTMEEQINRPGLDEEGREVHALASRIVLTVLMLADDPEIITPDVLIADQRKYDRASDEWKRKAERRARKEKKVGWNIGKNIQSIPHFRRPHFALRYTGPNGSIPKIVPVKSCMVKRNKLTSVPTGYVLPNGTEIEDGKPPRSQDI
jgi:hypothetical protein